MATVNFNDLIALIRRTVQTDLTTHTALDGKTLNEAIGGRIFSPALVDADAQTVERPCVIVDLLGGGAEYSFALEALTIYVYVYDDASQGRTTALYEAFTSIVQGSRLFDPDGNISAAGYAWEESRPIVGANEKMKSWFTRGVWSARLAG